MPVVETRSSKVPKEQHTQVQATIIRFAHVTANALKIRSIVSSNLQDSEMLLPLVRVFSDVTQKISDTFFCVACL